MPSAPGSNSAPSRPRRSLSRSRIALAVFKFVLLGLVSTVAVAWGAAVFIHVPGDLYAVKPGAPLKARQATGWRMTTPAEELATGLKGRAIALTRYDRFGSPYFAVDLLTAGGTGDRVNMEASYRSPEAVAGLFARDIVLPQARGLKPWPRACGGLRCAGFLRCAAPGGAGAGCARSAAMTYAGRPGGARVRSAAPGAAKGRDRGRRSDGGVVAQKPKEGIGTSNKT